MRPPTIVERLDFVAKRIPGLKFTPPTQLKPGDDQCYGCFMSCDMYYIEIKVDQSHQSVKDVIISHGNSAEGISCPVLRKVLAEQDFETFAKHLTGLHSIYQISTNDKKVKQRAYPALSALETDLTILYDHQRRRTSDCQYLVHKSPIGIMDQRRGGLPVRLTYFVTPYDLIDISLKTQINLNIQNIIDKNIGLSATVEIEGSSLHKIQVKSLISTQLNSTLPQYAPLNSQNSEKLPAQFVLNLSQPFPMLNTSICQIVNEVDNEPTTIKDYLINLTTSSRESLINLLARQELDLNKGPFNRSVDLGKQTDVVCEGFCDLKKHVYSIKLQDQLHTYHIMDNHLEKPEGVYITKIPFTHPTSIPSILKILRQQALFNFVIGSCIRRVTKTNTCNNPNSVMNSNNSNIGYVNYNMTNSYNDYNRAKLTQSSDVFDVIPVNLNNICISFEHPSKQSLATLEIDLKGVSEPTCQLHVLDKESVCSNEFATKVLQKCWSIPITLRSVLKKCNERRLALAENDRIQRERDMQELITNNPQQNFPMNLQDEPSNSTSNNLQSRLEINDIKIQDLKTQSSTDTTKLGSNIVSQTSHQSNQTTNAEEIADRSDLLKKFSCKPKAKQTLTQNNQAGNKHILSLMLKRQNPTPNSIEDNHLEATTTKKIKTKSAQSSHLTSKIPVINPASMAKVITLEGISSGKLPNKQNQRLIGSQGLSLTNDSDQFAIKQGSSGGLKLTVTKTKTTNLAPTSNQVSANSTSNIGSNNVNVSTNQVGDSKPSHTTAKTDANSLLNLGSTPAIKYTIPKLSKTQTSAQSQSTTTESTSNSSETSGAGKSEDLGLSSSSVGPSTSNIKRSTPFARAINSNRNNSVSSSTHPLGRTTSNPLANPNSRPSSSSNVNNTTSNRITSTGNQSQQMRSQSTSNRPLVNLLHLQSSNIQRLLNSNIQQPIQPSQQLNPPIYPIGIGHQAPAQVNQNAIDMNILAMSQVAMLNQQQQLRPTQVTQTIKPANSFMSSSIDVDLISSSTRPQNTGKISNVIHNVTSTSESSTIGSIVSKEADAQAISDPSSPAESNVADIVEPPPLIPIDAVQESLQATSPETDHPDDSSDRLSIIDTNENLDSTSVSGTPIPGTSEL